jgi:HEAT repeat protein
MSDAPRRTVTPDDSLPPVEPPTAAFLVQLFLVPAVIVGIIVFVWLAFHWLAQLGNDPEGYVKTLRRNNEGRWQAALNFANDLRGPGGKALKSDVGLARELGSILADEVASGRPRAAGHAGEQSQTLCGYLCRALGEFAVPEAAEPLVARAADDADPRTAQAAVEALAVLADNLAAAGHGFPDPAAVSAVLLAAAGSGDAALRSRAAYALGVVGGEGAAGRLAALLGDADDNVRFNAAVGLARRGDPAAWDVLGEMLSLADVEAAAGDDAAQSQRYKRALVALNGLKAVGLLVDVARQPPPAAVAARIAALRQDPVPDVRTAATALAAKIERLSPTDSPSPEQ